LYFFYFYFFKCYTSSIEKSFHDFRNLVTEFKSASKDATEKMEKTRGWEGVPESTQNLIAFSDAFAHVIDSEPISHFIGKVSYPFSFPCKKNTITF
jgi:hypothetical protein